VKWSCRRSIAPACGIRDNIHTRARRERFQFARLDQPNQPTEIDLPTEAAPPTDAVCEAAATHCAARFYGTESAVDRTGYRGALAPKLKKVPESSPAKLAYEFATGAHASLKRKTFVGTCHRKSSSDPEGLRGKSFAVITAGEVAGRSRPSRHRLFFSVGKSAGDGKNLLRGWALHIQGHTPSSWSLILGPSAAPSGHALVVDLEPGIPTVHPQMKCGHTSMCNVLS
jgi:hypothetical protein